MEKRVEIQSNSAMIDLSELQGQEIGNQTLIDFNDPNFCDQFLYLFSGKYKLLCQAINFGKNHIHTLQGLSALRHKFFPNLKKVNFGENKIQKFTELDYIKDTDRFHFTELSFIDNPIYSLDGYVEEVSARFPELVYLDAKKISIKFSGEKRKVLLGPPKGSFYDGSKTKELVEKFFVYYFKCLDEDRNKLLDLYSDTAVLSCTYEAYEGYEPNKESLESLVKNMNSNSRNLKKLTDIKQRQELLFKEKIPVVSFFVKEFPKSLHDMKDITVDAYVLSIEGQGAVIFATIHGAYQEQTTKFLRSFDRVVILSPPTKKDSQFPLMIVNENIHIRPYQKTFLAQLEKTGDNNFQEQQKLQTPQPIDDNVKKMAFQQLKLNTKMKDQYVMECLERCQWDYQKALDLFKRSNLPKEYFEQ